MEIFDITGQDEYAKIREKAFDKLAPALTKVSVPSGPNGQVPPMYYIQKLVALKMDIVLLKVEMTALSTLLSMKTMPMAEKTDEDVEQVFKAIDDKVMEFCDNLLEEMAESVKQNKSKIVTPNNGRFQT